MPFNSIEILLTLAIAIIVAALYVYAKHKNIQIIAQEEEDPFDSIIAELKVLIADFKVVAREQQELSVIVKDLEARVKDLHAKHKDEF